MMNVPKKVLDLWEAIDRVDPLPDTWSQNAQLCMQIERLIAHQMASCGSEYEINDHSFFMPPQWSPPDSPRTKAPVQSAEDQIRALDSQFKD